MWCCATHISRCSRPGAHRGHAARSRPSSIRWDSGRWRLGAAPPSTPVSGFSARIPGSDCGSSRRPCPTPRNRCCCGGRTCSATGTMPTMSVNTFVERAAANGIDVFRIFDAMNDLRNLRGGGQGVARDGQACPGHHVLHRQPGPQHRLLARHGPAARGHGLQLHLHQGHGRAAQALSSPRSSSAV